jgi:hypothetical protein
MSPLLSEDIDTFDDILKLMCTVKSKEIDAGYGMIRLLNIMCAL